MIAAIRGDDKTGKTSLILTFPKPLFHMDFDVGGFNRASHRFRQEIKDGLVVSKSYHIPQQSLRSRMGWIRRPLVCRRLIRWWASRNYGTRC